MEKDIDRIRFELLIANIPHYVFWKNIDYVYLGCNHNFSQTAGLISPEEIIGKTDYDLPWKDAAESYRKEDFEVITERKPLYEKETTLVTSQGNRLIILVSKVPLYVNNVIVGVLGIYTDITQRKQMEMELKIAKEKAEVALAAKEQAEAESREKSKTLQNILNDLKQKRYYLSGPYEGEYLTKREAECGYCLARGKSIKEVGKILKISPRTVEVHLNKIKTKLKAKNRSELISKLIECNFIEGIKPIL